ncbi:MULTISPECIES: hypothetical protein [unclassified Pseudomonas]|uniref:hypothetical protein n=1 Tax=unclassified Pseudomonas TaxID=196821 RepID=UPI0015A3FB1F|nr:MULTISPECIES: hypothetical protein [unclassified Pseudomonas]NVZ12953.1 hypothetical protein [Pseudomonas sp. IPO3775]NWA75884.1 hypothetical protein [Pseudomonas sp. C8002]
MAYPIFLYVKNFLIKTWQFFASVVVVFVVFVSQFHDLKAPEIILEVTSVKAISSQPVDLTKFAELSSLKSIVTGEERYFSMSRDRDYSPEEMDRILLTYKNSIATMTEDIGKWEKKLGSGMSGSDQKHTLDTLTELDDDLGTSRTTGLLFYSQFARPPKVPDENPSIEKQIELLLTSVNQKLEGKRKNRDNISSKYKEANKQWQDFKLNVMPSRTKLVITCAIGNQGSGATSLKPQALFRANLGEGNYLDFPMRMSDYDSSPEAATLQSQSYKVIKFESDEIQSMTAADRDRFKAFLGNASPARIFVSDVRGEVYESNSVPFSPGVYEQKMFDSLKQFASSKITR